MVSQLLLKIVNSLAAKKIRIHGFDPSLKILESFSRTFINRPESVVMLMPQEVYVAPDKKHRIDTVFGGFLAFDYKSSESEFDEAVRDAKEKYLPCLSKVRYYIITNWDLWRIYRVERDAGINLIPLFVGDRNQAANVLEQIIADEVKELKVPPLPSSIEALFTIGSEKLLADLKEVFEQVKDADKVRPLFEAYRKVMEMLYKGMREEEIVDLFIKHTLMHMTAMACLSATLRLSGDPTDVCSGALLTGDSRSLDVALPYLNWWKINYPFFQRNMQDKVKGIAQDVFIRALLVDWELGGKEDVFRRLYEVLVEPETRRRIGEYYTPLWIVDRILSEFDLKNRLILDPFCGSGTFLVRAFYEKVNSGEEPKMAYTELVGIDVNPLAVAIARAELIIAFLNVTGKTPEEPPHIYHVDTLAMWYGGEAFTLADPEYAGVISLASTHISVKFMEALKLIKSLSPQRILLSLSRIERKLSTGIKLAVLSGQDVEGFVRDYVLSNLSDEDPIERMFKEAVEETKFTANLAKLIEKYGDDVWAIAIVSGLMPSLAQILKPHIIVTNPPWVPTTEYQTSYVENMRKEATSLLVKMEIKRSKAASIVTGSDIACMALYKALQLAGEGVGFVMNREQSFYSRSPMRAGILLTYAAVKDACGDKCDVKLIDVDYDAFGHGVYPALVMVKKMRRKARGPVKLYRLTVSSRAASRAIAKDAVLEDVKGAISEEELAMSYEGYMEPEMLWATESEEKIASKLDVIKVVPKGGYIMGLLGGEKKKGKARYAGLVLEQYHVDDSIIYLKLTGLSRAYQAPIQLMKQYGVDIYWIYYRGLINPFKCKAYRAILSKRGSNLKGFLRAFMRFNEQSMTTEDRRKIEVLINELRVSLNTFNESSIYVIYRCNRAFTAGIPEVLENAASESHIAYVICKTIEQAYYYAAVLNYLAYKVIEMKRTFIRDQFAKPLIAIIMASLSWKGVPADIRNNVSKLSRALSGKLQWQKYTNQAKALEAVAQTPEFKQIISIFNQYIEKIGKDKLEEALNLVSTFKSE